MTSQGLTNIIAFIGPIKSGKDTAADFLIKRGIAKGKLSFAGPLKNICSKVFDVPQEYFHNQDLKEQLFEVPKILDTKTLESLDQEMKQYADVSGDLSQHIGKSLESPRIMLQYVGTEIMRALDPDFHVKAAFSQKALEGLEGTYCVIDARFVNEYRFLESMDNFSAFYIQRTSSEDALGSHESEKQILRLKAIVPKIITNNGTLVEFYSKVLEVVKDL